MVRYAGMERMEALKTITLNPPGSWERTVRRLP